MTSQGINDNKTDYRQLTHKLKVIIIARLRYEQARIPTNAKFRFNLKQKEKKSLTEMTRV